ncbi:MAG: helix-turn-helix domain-containing protein [Desulfurococcales archaeon]|nr:helix-turn-helix domain-containing protein [Desulfurococcales archaeon]
MANSTPKDYIIELIAKRIAGDIVFSQDPGAALKKWREYFDISQNEIARNMRIAPSVVSDYEKGRRRPGAGFIKRYVSALLAIDQLRGWTRVRQLMRTIGIPPEAVIDMREFDRKVTIAELVDLVKGVILTPNIDADRQIYGYTIVDSLRAIASLSGMQFYALLGATPERAIIFTGVQTGRSPMVAVRVSPVKPGVIVIHGPRRFIDPLAVELARLDGVPLILSLAESVDDIVKRLRAMTGYTSFSLPVA